MLELKRLVRGGNVLIESELFGSFKRKEKKNKKRLILAEIGLDSPALYRYDL
jgi:hypothetical protein